ncbi:hypothetical protein [Bacillus sp. FJAT-29814]|uniref:hypothetical protein n=1 Tax=Bacillus sp. FJAT-29814 TaxID=1729688 RepID=UPI00082B3B6C|nr:hypothetical protein [Bacillus sp. FJAT-29814]
MIRKYFSTLSLFISGILFVLYPAIRPFSDESSLEGAAAFASTEWLIAHICAIIGFTLLPLGILGLHILMKDTVLKSMTQSSLVLCILGIGFTLPFYGGETYGLHAIGLEALSRHNTELVSMANVVRSGPGLILFIIGLLLLAAASIIVAITIWKSGTHKKWSGIPFALGISLFLPQFFAGQPLRVAHGFLVFLGCVLISVYLWRQFSQNQAKENQSTTLSG